MKKTQVVDIKIFSIVFLKNERNKEGTRLQPLETLTVVLTLQMTTKENSYQILIYDQFII